MNAKLFFSRCVINEVKEIGWSWMGGCGWDVMRPDWRSSGRRSTRRLIGRLCGWCLTARTGVAAGRVAVASGRYDRGGRVAGTGSWHQLGSGYAYRLYVEPGFHCDQTLCVTELVVRELSELESTSHRRDLLLGNTALISRKRWLRGSTWTSCRHY